MKKTLSDIIQEMDIKESKISPIGGEILTSLEKLLSEAIDKSIKEFKVEAEKTKEDLIIELRSDVKKSTDYINSLIPVKGDKGDNYVLTEENKKEIADKIKVPIVEKIVEKTEIIKEQPIITNEIKEVAVTDTGKKIVEKINAAPLEPKYQIKAEHIIGLPDTSGFIKKQGYHGGGDINMSYILDPFLDGVTKGFTIPENRRVNYVICSSAPFIITINDFTLSGTRNTTLTFGANVDASMSLAAGQSCVVDYII